MIEPESNEPYASQQEVKRLKVDPVGSINLFCWLFKFVVSQDGALSGLTFRVISNDGSDANSEDLIALKNIISRQLPKMPKEYIVRLVFDRRHISMVICKNNVIIGGICYRPYPEQRFGEIAFCAISGTEQVRGYGTLLMNNLKNYAQQESKFFSVIVKSFILNPIGFRFGIFLDIC